MIGQDDMIHGAIHHLGDSISLSSSIITPWYHIALLLNPKPMSQGMVTASLAVPMDSGRWGLEGGMSGRILSIYPDGFWPNIPKYLLEPPKILPGSPNGVTRKAPRRL